MQDQTAHNESKPKVINFVISAFHPSLAQHLVTAHNSEYASEDQVESFNQVFEICHQIGIFSEEDSHWACLRATSEECIDWAEEKVLAHIKRSGISTDTYTQLLKCLQYDNKIAQSSIVLRQSLSALELSGKIKEADALEMIEQLRHIEAMIMQHSVYA